MRNSWQKPQKGAVLPLVGVTLVVLLGFGGLVIDLGGLFVAKTELQSALDSCALAAAQELDGAPDALVRATSAGMTAGNVNKVAYQKAAAGIITGDITFSASLNGVSLNDPKLAKYAKCSHTTAGIAAYLIQVLGESSTHSVGALAVATRGHAQSTCPIPVGLLPKVGGMKPDYGYAPGEWVTMLYGGGSPAPGEMGWYNLDGSNSASETEKEITGTGYCGSRTNDLLGTPVGTPGAKSSVGDAWNARFGIYKKNPKSGTKGPDFTGYAYTLQNWPAGRQAYDGMPGTCPKGGKCSTATAANFQAKRQAHASYDDTGTSVNDGDKISGLNMKGGYKDLATPGTGGQHQTLGLNMRIVLVPVIVSSKIADFACMLMLQPIEKSTDPVKMEYLGNAGSINSPCTANGLPGGSAGPLTPMLVR